MQAIRFCTTKNSNIPCTLVPRSPFSSPSVRRRLPLFPTVKSPLFPLLLRPSLLLPEKGSLQSYAGGKKKEEDGKKASLFPPPLVFSGGEEEEEDGGGTAARAVRIRRDPRGRRRPREEEKLQLGVKETRYLRRSGGDNRRYAGACFTGLLCLHCTEGTH